MILVLIGAGFSFAWAGAEGIIDMTDIFGICGFQQTYQLPCPGCFWTRSIQHFSHGRVFKAFYTQPAAALFCVAVLIVAVLSLLTALFGIKYRFMQGAEFKKLLKYVIVASIVIFLAGWAVTLARQVSTNV